jgi:pilus assembly protein FimV
VGNFASKIWFWIITCMVVPSAACAAGLGNLTVQSMLGQPLNAEIEIVSLQGGEGDTLAARLASSEAFRQANIDLNPALLAVKFAVVRKPDGRYVMTMTSKQPISEPFVDMLVELNWSNGRLVREYTFLLDPPEYAGPPKATQGSIASTAVLPRTTSPQPAEAVPTAPAAPATSSAPAEPLAPAQAAAAATAAPAQREPAQPMIVVPAQAAPSEASQGQTPPTEGQPASAPVQVGAAPAAEAPTALVQEPPAAVTYEVKRGDTLSKIAMRNSADGVNLQQMLVAMFRANQEAFVGDNMNRLRAGKIINIPEKEAAASVNSTDARRIVVAQFADFKDYRRSLGGAVAAAPAPQESGRQVSGSITAQEKEKPTPQKGATKDQLRLSGADDAKRGGKAAGTAVADDLAAKEKALREANERIALLEKNLQDLQKLAQVKSEAGAQLQQQAQAAKAGQAGQPPKQAQLEGPAKVAPAPKVEAPKGPEAAKAAEAAKPVPAAKAPEAAKTVEPPKGPVATKGPEPAKAPEAGKAPVAPQPPAQVAKAAEPAKAPEAGKATEAAKAPEAIAKAAVPGKPEAPKAAPPTAPKTAPQPAPSEPSFFDELLDNPYALGGAGGAVILLAGYATYAWRKKRTTQFASGVMSVAPSDVNSVLGTAGGRNIDTGSSSFQSDFSQAGIGKIDTEEIDPIAEADVYMAYGRDAQAEEILREALAKDSSRQAIRLKLLEIYANRKDARAFEAAANELHAATGGRGPDWDKAANLGLSIDPTNTLYGGKPSAGMATTRMAAVAAAPDTDTTQQGGPVNIDFDIGGVTGTTPPPDINLDAGTPSQAGSGPAGLDFDLGLGGDKLAQESPTAAIAPAPAAPAEDSGLMSIDFNLPASEAPAQAAPEPVSAGPATDLGAIDFDIGLPGSAEARTEAKTETTSQAPAIELGAISLDLGTPGGGNGSGGAPDAQWQEVATKLDLAKAYGEMGDKDGARELLKEVVKEGDTAQQQQAQTMLQTLG